jgi:hypothetical protein
MRVLSKQGEQGEQRAQGLIVGGVRVREEKKRGLLAGERAYKRGWMERTSWNIDIEFL